MTILQIDGRFGIVRLELAPAEIPDLLRRHAERYAGVDRLEDAGRILVKGGFEAAESRVFVESVCKWGRGYRFVDRVLEKNTDGEIASALREGYAEALKDHVAEGVQRIGGLNYLAQSFASKQLRFLTPTQAVILDSVIRARLGYEETVEGYREFLKDCRALLMHLQRSTQLEPEFRSTLRVCDVETALFAKIQGY